MYNTKIQLHISFQTEYLFNIYFKINQEKTFKISKGLKFIQI